MSTYNKEKTNEKIRKLLNDTNTTQHQLAELLEVQDSRISECFKGFRDFTTEQLCVISNHFNVSLDFLLLDSQTSQPCTTSTADNNLSELFQQLFCLLENKFLYISHEFIDEHVDTSKCYDCDMYNQYLHQLENSDEPFGFDYACMNSCGRVHVPASKGSLCISTSNIFIKQFLEEYAKLMQIRDTSYFEAAYTSFKKTTIDNAKLQQFKYDYLTELEYQLELFYKHRPCLSETDFKLLDEFKKNYPNFIKKSNEVPWSLGVSDIPLDELPEKYNFLLSHTNPSTNFSFAP